MRVGQNPAKFVRSVSQPAPITATVVNCIPFLSGFYEESLTVLNECLSSLHSSREERCDIMVFDNHSCQEVRQFLLEAYGKGIIQYLILSETNIGKIGAWNFMFGAAQGDYIAFCDSDVYFRPGWLSACLELFDRFPNVGLVTGRPTRSKEEFSSATIAWAEGLEEDGYRKGILMDWNTYREHALSLGHPEEQARAEFLAGRDHLLTHKGVSAFAGASHFQFIARREALSRIVPLASEKPMRGEEALDKAVNDLGYLRLSTVIPYVLHLGNRAPGQSPGPKGMRASRPWLNTFFNLAPIRSFLLRLYGVIFHIYFNNVP